MNFVGYLFSKFVLVHEFLKQRQLDGLAGVAPQLVARPSAAPSTAARLLGRAQRQALAHRALLQIHRR